jgi:hypothetical protein
MSSNPRKNFPQALPKNLPHGTSGYLSDILAAIATAQQTTAQAAAQAGSTTINIGVININVDRSGSEQDNNCPGSEQGETRIGGKKRSRGDELSNLAKQTGRRVHLPRATELLTMTRRNGYEICSTCAATSTRSLSGDSTRSLSGEAELDFDAPVPEPPTQQRALPGTLIRIHTATGMGGRSSESGGDSLYVLSVNGAIAICLDRAGNEYELALDQPNLLVDEIVPRM